MSDDELRLNRLHRYQKTSARLSLEVHSHCEVPAGCGGAVLRWRQADGPVGLSGSFYFASAEPAVTLDGEPLDARRTIVSPGRHALAFAMEVPAVLDGFFVGALSFSPPISTALVTRFTTSTPAAWRATRAAQPDERWRLPDFDDSAFAPLVTRAVPKPDAKNNFRWEYLSRDHTGLALPPSLSKQRGPVFVRGVFTLGPRGFVV